MLHNFNQYQIRALDQLAEYRYIFRNPGTPLKTDSRPVKGSKVSLDELMDGFIETFCQGNFADADYSSIQQKNSSITALEDWANSLSFEEILQFFTYTIWTNKTYKGFFLYKINDGTFEKVLERLHALLNEYHQSHNKPQVKVTVINTAKNTVNKS